MARPSFGFFFPVLFADLGGAPGAGLEDLEPEPRGVPHSEQ